MATVRSPERTATSVVRPQGFDHPQRDAVAGVEVLGAAARDRVARHLERAERDRAGRFDLQQRAPLRQPTRGRRGADDAEQRLAEFRARGGQSGVAPVAVGGDDGVVERCASSAAAGSWIRRARCDAAGRSRCPDGHPVHDRMSDVCSVPSESTAKLGTPRLSTATVRGLEVVDPAGSVLVDGHLGVGEVVDQCGDRRLEAVRGRRR